MHDDSYYVCFLVDKPSETLVERVAEHCRNSEFKVKHITSEDDSKDICLEYDNITDIEISFDFFDERDWNEPRILLSFSTMPLYTSDGGVNPEEHTRERVQPRVDAIVDLAKELVTLCDPAYAYGMLFVGPKPSDGVRPMAKPISENISRLSWLMVFSPSTIDELGGRERVLETPAWKVEEVDTGHILIVRSDNPVDPTITPDVSPEEYLFEGKDLAELRAGPELSDPFDNFEPGDLGGTS